MAAAYGILLAITLIWGATFPIVQLALEDSSPFAFVAVRFSLAALLFAALFHKRLRRASRDQLVKGAILGVLLWAGFAFQTMGLARTTAARSGFITGLLVPLTPVFAWLIFRERIHLRLWIAVLLAFAGLAIMSQPEAGGLNSGDVLTLCCAIVFALQVACVGRWSNQQNDIELTGIQLGATAVIALISVAFEPGAHYDLNSTRLISITLFNAVFATALAIWAQLRYQPRMSPAAAAVIYACEPLFAGIAAWAFLQHVPSIATLYGAAFILAGMILSSLPVKSKPAFS